MAHWFHRNPLKATAPQNFDLRGVSTNGNTQKICTDLRQARIKLLDVIANPNNEVSTLEVTAKSYFALLHGFIHSCDPESSGESKLLKAIRFRWTNTLFGNTAMECYNAVFDAASMAMNIALWYTKHASKLASQEQPTMEEAKDVHKSLRTAAGIFSYIKENLAGKLPSEVSEKGSDMDSRVITAYMNQCTAEAQEVTIARAIELKHQPNIVSALAYETAKMFQAADDSLAAVDDTRVTKWRKYCQFKINIYYAYAYNYHGESLLAEDKCGEAIKCLQESLSHYGKALTFSQEYCSTKGAGTTCKPHEHLFFKKLGPVVKRTLEKCERENGFIYHQKVPPTVADLQLKATYGLVAPEDFELPPASEVWTARVYKDFDETKIPEEPSGKEKKSKDKKDDLPPVKEDDIPRKDPTTFSGCVVS